MIYTLRFVGLGNREGTFINIESGAASFSEYFIHDSSRSSETEEMLTIDSLTI